MLVSQYVPSGLSRRHGGRRPSLAELRRRLAVPSNFEDGHQQRLEELVQRLDRVRAIGNEYARLELSEFVTSAMDRSVVAV